MAGKKVVRLLLAGVLMLTLGTVFSGCCCNKIAALEEQLNMTSSKADSALTAAQSAQAMATAASAKVDAASAKADEAVAAANRADAAAQSAAQSAKKAEAIFMKNTGK